MADAINTGNPTHATFIWNKYDDIDGGRVAQDTPRGRMCFMDSDGRLTLPRSVAESAKAVFAVDWAKPLNPGPYFLNAGGLNGTTVYPFNDGSLGEQVSDFVIDPDVVFQAPWPIAIGPTYDISPLFYDKPVPSGAKCLVLDEGTFTFCSGNYAGAASDFVIGGAVYAANTSGDEGKIAASVSGVTNSVGVVVNKDVFGANSITVKLFGSSKLG